MSAILPFIKIDSASLLANYFTHYQICWIEAEDPFHEAKKQVFALAEKSVRIGWTFCDGFKNVRKRLRFKNRDYLFVTKDWPSALEYMNQVYDFADMLGYTRAVLSHGEDVVKVKHLNAKLLWQTAQARVTWACDLAVWSSHDGEDTLFNEFAQQARAACGAHDSARANSSANLTELTTD